MVNLIVVCTVGCWELVSPTCGTWIMAYKSFRIIVSDRYRQWQAVVCSYLIVGGEGDFCLFEWVFFTLGLSLVVCWPAWLFHSALLIITAQLSHYPEILSLILLSQCQSNTPHMKLQQIQFEKQSKLYSYFSFTFNGTIFKIVRMIYVVRRSVHSLVQLTIKSPEVDSFTRTFSFLQQFTFCSLSYETQGLHSNLTVICCER